MAFKRYDPRKFKREPQKRINHRIRVPEIRVIDADGAMLGVMSTQDALRRAREQGLDLVEINPKAVPPVCKILDFGRFKYDEKKKKRETKRKQSVVEVKEIKLRPKTDDHDLDFKMRAARRFMESGNKVKVTVRFRGREITHPEKAREQIEWIVERCMDIGVLEVKASMESRTMTAMMAPKAAVLQKLAEQRAQAEKERKEAEVARLAAKGGKQSTPGLEPNLDVPDLEEEDEEDEGDEDEDLGLDQAEAGG
jgi:translation initiation factor IF-3